MTEKEYEEAIATQNAIIHSHEKEINVARRKKREVTEVFEQSLSDRYADFVGKKVEITFSIPTGRGDCTIKTVTGFLSGFKYGGVHIKNSSYSCKGQERWFCQSQSLLRFGLSEL